MTRDIDLPAIVQAIIHELHPGDLLFVRVDRPSLDARHADAIVAQVKARVPDGVEVLVGGRDVTLEQYRRVDP